MIVVGTLSKLTSYGADQSVAIIVVAAVEVQMRLVHRPYLGQVKDERTADGVIKQSNASTCAAAACANIVRHFGRDVTEADMIHVLNTSWEGTSPAQIVYGLRSLGFDARKVNSPGRNLAEIRPPAVLLVDVGMEADAHAIAYIRRDGGNFEILDSASKRTMAAPDKIRERWRGHAIEVSLPVVDNR